MKEEDIQDIEDMEPKYETLGSLITLDFETVDDFLHFYLADSGQCVGVIPLEAMRNKKFRLDLTLQGLCKDKKSGDNGDSGDGGIDGKEI